MMRNAINDFAKQFEWTPEIQNAGNLVKMEKFILCGMGGSHLAAGLLKALKPELPLVIHQDYGLPELAEEDLRQSLVIASSYSGNTEEVLESYRQAKAKGLKLAVISIGGKLIDLAKQDEVPYIQMPDQGIQPRSALGFSFRALLALMGEDGLMSKSRELVNLVPADFEASGQMLAQKTEGRVPVIYASAKNLSVAYNWKIKLNETGKVPAFYNVFPELNHNEMTGFDVADSTKKLSEGFFFILLKDTDDNLRVQKRMGILEKLYRERGLNLETVILSGKSRMEKIFSALIIADWFALHTAEKYGVESEQVPMVEEFKRLIE